VLIRVFNSFWLFWFDLLFKGDYSMNENYRQTKPVDCVEELNHQNIFPRFFSVAELMAITGLSRSSINRHIKSGDIPTARVGSRILIPRSYLETLQVTAKAVVKGSK
jgi:excisionase family DNA binding protein